MELVPRMRDRESRRQHAWPARKSIGDRGSAALNGAARRPPHAKREHAHRAMRREGSGFRAAGCWARSPSSSALPFFARGWAVSSLLARQLAIALPSRVLVMHARLDCGPGVRCRWIRRHRRGHAAACGLVDCSAPDAKFARLTVLYLHGQDGNFGDTLDALARLHAAGVNVLAFDYRGYGQSQFVRPSEAHWRQDAEWAIEYLTETRHVAPGAIVLDGSGSGREPGARSGRSPSGVGRTVVRIADCGPAEFDLQRCAGADGSRARCWCSDRYDLNAAPAGVKVPVAVVSATNAE